MVFFDCICISHQGMVFSRRPSLAGSGLSSPSIEEGSPTSPTYSVHSTCDTINSGSLVSSKYLPSLQNTHADIEKVTNDELEQQFTMAQSYENDDAAETNISKAIIAYKKCLALSRNRHSPSWAALGHIYACTKFDFASAAVCFTYLVGLEPREVEHHHTLGLALIAQGRAKEALNAYASGLRLNPSHIELNFNTALVWHDLKAYDQATIGYKKVIALCMEQLNQVYSNDSFTRLSKILVESQDHLALLYSERGDLKNALTVYQQMDLALLTPEMKGNLLQSVEFLKREIEARSL